MATARIDHPVSTAPTTSSRTSDHSLSPMATALATGVACIVLVWAATIALMLVLTSTSVWGAVGVGAYAAFWLGGGFGAIFGSAAVFGKEH